MGKTAQITSSEPQTSPSFRAKTFVELDSPIPHIYIFYMLQKTNVLFIFVHWDFILFVL